jgi:putative oxygen-independent coproporphyrinogen III oxidase
MGDIAPVAGAAVVRHQTGPIIAVLVDPGLDHLAIAIGIAGAHPEIFALPGAAAGLRIMGKFSGAGQSRGIDGGILGQFRVPDQFRCADPCPDLIMGAHHCALQAAVAAGLGRHAGAGLDDRDRGLPVRGRRGASRNGWRDQKDGAKGADNMHEVVSTRKKMNGSDMGPLALYIHWPFCVSKCPYCDFNSHVREQVDVAAWQDALLADMAHEAALVPGRKLSSIFFGGGTPSLMPPELVEALIAAAERHWGFADAIEITLEANPSSVEAANFHDLAGAGVNRVSLGLQALDEETLGFLGRAHDVAEGLAALNIAQRAFGRVSFDLIYARPGQTLDAWQAELERALGFGTGHLSLYQLTIEPGTRFETLVRTGALVPADDDHCADLFELTRDIMTAAGLPAYEISNHAKPGQESRHNLTYWRYQDYVGIGPGAHGRRLESATERHKKPENFLSAAARNGNGLKVEQPLSPQTRAMEALMMGLRLAEGVDLEALEAKTELTAAAMVDGGEVQKLADMGFLLQRDGRLTVRPKGMPLLDALLPRIISDLLRT